MILLARRSMLLGPRAVLNISGHRTTAVRFSVKLVPVFAGEYVPVAVPSPVMPLRNPWDD